MSAAVDHEAFCADEHEPILEELPARRRRWKGALLGAAVGALVCGSAIVALRQPQATLQNKGASPSELFSSDSNSEALICTGMDSCGLSDSTLRKWNKDPKELAKQVPKHLDYLPAVNQKQTAKLLAFWNAAMPRLPGGAVATTESIASYMALVLGSDPFGTGDKLPYVNLHHANEGKVIGITQKQFAFIVANVLMGNDIEGGNGLSQALAHCTGAPPELPFPSTEFAQAGEAPPSEPPSRPASSGIAGSLQKEAAAVPTPPVLPGAPPAANLSDPLKGQFWGFTPAPKEELPDVPGFHPDRTALRRMMERGWRWYVHYDLPDSDDAENIDGGDVIAAMQFAYQHSYKAFALNIGRAWMKRTPAPPTQDMLKYMGTENPVIFFVYDPEQAVTTRVLGQDEDIKQVAAQMFAGREHHKVVLNIPAEEAAREEPQAAPEVPSLTASPMSPNMVPRRLQEQPDVLLRGLHEQDWPTDILLSLFSFLAVLSSELGDGSQGSMLVAASPDWKPDSWKDKLESATLQQPNIVVKVPHHPMWSDDADFMDGSIENMAITDIAGGVVGGGARLCNIANTQDESLVQFYSEVLALAFFVQGDTGMLTVPITLLGARRYMNSIEGQSSGYSCGTIPREGWINTDIMKATTEVQISGRPVKIASSAFVAVKSDCSQAKAGGSCKVADMVNNKCAAQRNHLDIDLDLWIQVYDAAKYNPTVQGAFKTLVRRVGTGPWGAGEWHGDGQQYFLAVWLANALIGDDAPELDYYLYSKFCENPGNQCFLLGNPGCGICIDEVDLPFQPLDKGACGQTDIWKTVESFKGQPAKRLYDVLNSVDGPPQQVFDAIR